MKFDVKDPDVREIEYSDPLDFFREYSGMYYSCLLSGNGPGDISEFSFIGIYPHTIIRYINGVFEIESESGTRYEKSEFWEFINRVFESTNFHSQPFPANMCGAAGYLSFEGYHTIERIDSGTEENYKMPVLEIILYNDYVVFDNRNERSYYISLNYSSKSIIKKEWEKGTGRVELSNIRQECTKEEYIQKVEKIRDYIIEGDVYEVCLTQQFNGEFSGNPFYFFSELYKSNPSPFSAYLNNRDIVVICNSPELFVRCRGKKVETRPIKGTAPRSSDRKEDNNNKENLLKSEKDQAELYMIIDLLRNDIGKVCRTGSVRVVESKRLEAYENVFQLIGVVEGELGEGQNYMDLLHATFPGGSVTGCPKVRSIEIIEELETYKRNLYTGTIFYFNREYYISNIVIRTAIISEGKIYFNSGGAVTIDSVPEMEYDEIMHKIRNIYNTG